MTIPIEPLPQPPSSRPRRRRGGWTLRLTPGGVVLLLAVDILLMIALALSMNRLLNGSLVKLPQVSPAASSQSTKTVTPTPSATQIPVSTPLPPVSSLTSTSIPTSSATPSPTSAPISAQVLSQGLILLALQDNGNSHLFAYQPQETGAGQPLPLTRLTIGPWDDITPALSPDGKQVAFASNRTGYWDLYLLDLPSGGVNRLTDSRDYEAAPSWSPDGQWLAYEAYVDQNLEIFIRPLGQAGEIIRLTSHPAADFSPAWSPGGRSIAFVSDRSGESEIWLADLDQPEQQRFRDISQNPGGCDLHPAWSPDGSLLAWAGEQDGFHNLYLWKANQTPDPSTPPVQPGGETIGSGDWPAWSPDGQILLSLLETPDRSYLTAYPLGTPGLVFPTLSLPGSLSGLVWGNASLPLPIREPYKQAAQSTPTPLYLPMLTALPDELGGRYTLVKLEDIQAPFPVLHDLTDESFQALRKYIATLSGWDFLATLENAFVPLTSPLDPGMGNDWLYTGRAFAFITIPINAGWVAVTREDFGAQTYWRVYVRARYQDGSAGIPLHERPWDFYARYNGDPAIYEQGGTRLEAILPGYWIDFTQLALDYGWERMPALSTWRASYPAARFNEFALTNGLDWQTAMLELYPPEALITPSPVVPPTRTLTPTSRWYQTPTPTSTSTPRPTFTPISPTPTPTPVPSATRTSTSTPPTPSPTYTRTPATLTPHPSATSTP